VFLESLSNRFSFVFSFVAFVLTSCYFVVKSVGFPLLPLFLRVSKVFVFDCGLPRYARVLILICTQLTDGRPRRQIQKDFCVPEYSLQINGKLHRVNAEPDTPLLLTCGAAMSAFSAGAALRSA
jgi:hypothetical protein